MKKNESKVWDLSAILNSDDPNVYRARFMVCSVYPAIPDVEKLVQTYVKVHESNNIRDLTAAELKSKKVKGDLVLAMQLLC